MDIREFDGELRISVEEGVKVLVQMARRLAELRDDAVDLHGDVSLRARRELRP